MGGLKSRDDELIEAYRNSGDVRWLNDLFSPYMGQVRGMMYQMVLNDADADDVTQEVFIRAARGIHGFNGHSRFPTWLYRISMNCAKSFLAKRARSPVEHRDTLPEQAAGPGSDPGDATAAGELDARIREALSELSPKLRSAIVLVVMQEVGVTEAARVERCAAATMYWRVHEARRQLKRKLEAYLS